MSDSDDSSPGGGFEGRKITRNTPLTFTGRVEDKESESSDDGAVPQNCDKEEDLPVPVPPSLQATRVMNFLYAPSPQGIRRVPQRTSPRGRSAVEDGPSYVVSGGQHVPAPAARRARTPPASRGAQGRPPARRTARTPPPPRGRFLEHTATSMQRQRGGRDTSRPPANGPSPRGGSSPAWVGRLHPQHEELDKWHQQVFQQSAPWRRSPTPPPPVPQQQHQHQQQRKAREAATPVESGGNIWSKLYSTGMGQKAKKERIEQQESKRKLMAEEHMIKDTCTFKPNISLAAHESCLRCGPETVYERLAADRRKEENKDSNKSTRVARKVDAEESHRLFERLHRDASTREHRRRAQVDRAMEMEELAIRASQWQTNRHFVDRELHTHAFK